MESLEKLQDFMPYSKQEISNEDKEEVIKALFSQNITQGQILQEYEAKVASYSGVKNALAFNSATSSLYAAFNILASYCHAKERVCEVITSPISFVATTNMMLANNLRPVFADIKFDGNIDSSKVEELITKNTIAICAIDYAGQSVDIFELQKIAKKHNLYLIQDSSHAFGASIKDKDSKEFIKLGGLSFISIFSTHALKPFTTAEGGLLLSNDLEVIQAAKLIRSHGVVKKELYDLEVNSLGFNFRLNELSAALGLSQLKRLDFFIQKREEIASFYDEFFKDNKYFYPLKIAKNKISSRHLYVILLDRTLRCKKQDIVRDLLALNIGVQVHYKPIYKFKLYEGFRRKNPLLAKGISKELDKEGFLSNAEEFYEAALSIPCNQSMDLDLALRIAKMILAVCKKHY